MPTTKSSTKKATLSAPLRELKQKGHTLRSAAAELGVNNSHLYRVLTGERRSARLLTLARSLQPRTQPRTQPTP